MSYTTCTALLFRAYVFVASGRIRPSSPRTAFITSSGPTSTVANGHLLPTPTILSQTPLTNVSTVCATIALTIVLSILLLTLLATTKTIKVSSTRISLLLALIATSATYANFLRYSLGDLLATPQNLTTIWNEIQQWAVDVHDYYIAVACIASTNPYFRWLPPVISILDECARWHGAYLQICIATAFVRKTWYNRMKSTEDESSDKQATPRNMAGGNSLRESDPQSDTNTGSSTTNETLSSSVLSSSPASPPRYIRLRRSKGVILASDHIASLEEIDVQLKRIKQEQDAAKQRAAARNSTYFNMIKYRIQDLWSEYGFTLRLRAGDSEQELLQADDIHIIPRRVNSPPSKSNNKSSSNPAATTSPKRDRRPRRKATISVPKKSESPTPVCEGGEKTQAKAPVPVREEEKTKPTWPAGQHNGYQYEVIGKGGFGSVYRVTHAEYPTAFAVKKFEPDQRDDYIREENNLHQILSLDRDRQHRFIQMTYIWPMGNKFNSIAMELIGPDLHTYKDSVASKGYRTSIVDLQSITYQVTDALDFMHAYGIIHVDIKLANIGLISGEWTEDLAEARERKLPRVAKLCNNDIRILDFGLMTDSRPHPNYCGTRGFDPPEVILNMPWTSPRDLWSLGMLSLIWYDPRPGNPFDLYQLDKKFTPRETLSVLTNIVLPPIPFNMLSQLQSPFSEWFDKLGRLTPGQPVGDQVLQHFRPLATYFSFEHHMTACLYYFIRDLLTVDPSTRITTTDALKHDFLRPLDGKNLSIYQ